MFSLVTDLFRTRSSGPLERAVDDSVPFIPLCFRPDVNSCYAGSTVDGWFDRCPLLRSLSFLDDTASETDSSGV
ncbi:hypothetical protein EA462_17295 [Natrarchaeobius halalkaliphilus]|uniref:Uncharacterized protein n=1 Tax=Natrarchaeobius halalkaliphilus TaxID=1679091 RepID=A0A3N6LXV5_9EURY|nr:hypothetical protein EA462_17295 [Natrarchaeobius halalkaliphilus]